MAVVALVAALAGGAYAASGGLTGKQKKEVKTIAKSFQGSGPVGPVGPKGDPGSKGDPGAKGTPGVDGKSVVIGTEAKGPNCSEGGSSLEVEGSGSQKFACNGKEGSPWVAGGTLPSGKTETGVWDATPITPGATFVSLSYAIPLEAAPGAVTIVQEGETEVEGCPGAEPTPEADPGFLCLYVAETSLEEVSGFPTGVNSPAGAVLVFPLFGEGAFARGTWAVTAE